MSQTIYDNSIENYFFKSIGHLPYSMTYIPSKTDVTRKYFKIIKDHFTEIGIAEIHYCDFDKEYSQHSLELLKKSKCIYLSGGITPYFLEQLQKREVLGELRDLAIGGTPIIGVSAGALIMGKNLDILLDDPEEGEATRSMINRQGLGLYDFEFWPHFGQNKNDELRLRARCSNNGIKIFGSDDQSGLMKIDNEWSIYGNTICFEKFKE